MLRKCAIFKNYRLHFCLTKYKVVLTITENITHRSTLTKNNTVYYFNRKKK